MSLKIYHNPRCSKSRQALEYLKEQGFKPEIIDYMANPISKSELKEVINKLAIEPRDLLRKGEADYKENNLADLALSDDKIIDFMIKFPKLMERPIIVQGNEACIARPLDNLMEMVKNG